MARIRVLLVEDEAPKRLHIERFLETFDGRIAFSIAKSVNSALDAIEKSPPDLLLLDMSLPTFDVGERESGGRPQGFGGIEILRHMVLEGIVCSAIVITGYEAFPRETGKPMELSRLKVELEQEFPALLRSVLHYNSTYDEWKTELSAALAELGIQEGGDN